MENSNLQRNIGFLLHDVARLMRKAFDQHMEPLGVTRSQWWVLVHLYREDGITQRELANILDLGKVALSGLLDRLESKGWVERRSDPNDKRAKRVFLTEQASGITEEMMGNARVVMDSVTFDMSEDEQDQLANLLVGLKGNLINAGYGPQLNMVNGDHAARQGSD